LRIPKSPSTTNPRTVDRSAETAQPAIAPLEGGERPPRIDMLLRIANALDCELAVELRPRA